MIFLPSNFCAAGVFLLKFVLPGTQSVYQIWLESPNFCQLVPFAEEYLLAGYGYGLSGIAYLEYLRWDAQSAQILEKYERYSLLVCCLCSVLTFRVGVYCTGMVFTAVEDAVLVVFRFPFFFGYLCV
jgi:hypothetical protein